MPRDGGRFLDVCHAVVPLPREKPEAPPERGHRMSGRHGNQASTLSGLSSIHFWAASSGSIPSSAMYFETRFWSSLVHSKFLIRSTAGESESANFVEISLFSAYGG